MTATAIYALVSGGTLAATLGALFKLGSTLGNLNGTLAQIDARLERVENTVAGCPVRSTH